MSFTCIQCTLRALVAGESSPLFTESMEEHAARVHPDREALLAERRVLEEQLAGRVLQELRGKTLPKREPPDA